MEHRARPRIGRRTQTGRRSPRRTGPALRKATVIVLAMASLLGPLDLPASAANVPGTVDVAAGETLRVRSQPNTTSTVVANLADNSTVSIICSVTGPSVTGTVRTTTQWDKLSNGYVSHAFIRSTGTIEPCSTSTSTAPQGKVAVAAGNTLTVRSTPSTSGSPVGTLANGAVITLVCSTSGTSVNGNSTWYKLSNGYVSAAYVTRTNTVTLPACTTTTPPPPSTSSVRATFIQRADYWYRASNGQVAGVAAFGRNPSLSAKEGPTGTALYRRDCSGLIAMAWNLGAGTQPSSQALNNSAYTVAVNVDDLQAGDILTTNLTSGGHVTMFHKWTDSSKTAYWAYDFGGGSGGAGYMEYRTYTITRLSATTARRGTDTRTYYARRSIKTN